MSKFYKKMSVFCLVLLYVNLLHTMHTHDMIKNKPKLYMSIQKFLVKGR